MNKLMGFFELKYSGLPTIHWNEFEQNELDNNLLWTVRTAVNEGNDLSLPRLVGVTAEEATEFASAMSDKFKDQGMVIYYPYFIVEKSGNLNIFSDRYVIEAVKDDLWNLVDHSKVDVTIIANAEGKNVIGNDKFLAYDELMELEKYMKEVRKMYRENLITGESILLEWSYAYNCDKNKNIIGNKYLVFYEARTV